MKRGFVAFGLWVWASGFSVHAAIVDDLACRLEFGGHEGYPQVTSVLPLRGVRGPSSRIPEPGTAYTEAEVKFSARAMADPRTPPTYAAVDGRLFYVHAIKLSESGQPIEAFHWRCVDIALNVDGQVFKFPCLASPADPFRDSTGAWARVGIKDGVPSFAVREFVFQATDTPVGPVILHCVRNATIP